MRNKSPSPAEAGFALLEALVAFTVLALGASIVWLTYRSGMEQQQIGVLHRRAVLLAQSKLEEIDGRRIATGQDLSGVEGPFSWTARVSRFEPGFGPAAPAAGALRERRVVVTYRVGKSIRRVVLHTLRLSRGRR